jgi:ubiquinone/menaquinone biosynthesis C-methylase UbiE
LPENRAPFDVEEIRGYYRARATADRYATSPDFQLRELEIARIGAHLVPGERVLDLGCGNGYSVFRHAERVDADFLGLDFVPEMVRAAEELRGRFTLRGRVALAVGDATRIDRPDASFDTVVSQRCLLNLPSREAQWQALGEVARVLVPEGRYLMLEGTLQGLRRLNAMRERFDLAPIPEADEKTNWFSNKFDEPELEARLRTLGLRIESVERFGMYFFLARVVHPMLVAPEAPRYDAAINDVARRIAETLPDFDGLGHVALWVLRKTGGS